MHYLNIRSEKMDLLVGCLLFVQCTICMGTPDPMPLFKRIDADKDGEFQDTELVHAILRYDTSGDHAVTKSEYVQKYQDFNFGPADEAAEIFSLADLNKDGVLNGTDVQLVMHLYDLNQDGHVDEAEFVTVFNKSVTAYEALRPAKIYASIDRDKDGTITQSDFTKAFMVYDVNGDGKVTLAEMIEKMKEHGENDVARVTGFFHGTDVNHDNLLNVVDSTTLFQAFDVNDDHVVTQAEFINGYKKYANLAAITTTPSA